MCEEPLTSFDLPVIKHFSMGRAKQATTLKDKFNDATLDVLR